MATLMGVAAVFVAVNPFFVEWKLKTILSKLEKEKENLKSTNRENKKLFEQVLEYEQNSNNYIALNFNQLLHLFNKKNNVIPRILVVTKTKPYVKQYILKDISHVYNNDGFLKVADNVICEKTNQINKNDIMIIRLLNPEEYFKITN
jgi:hypothetical protein